MTDDDVLDAAALDGFGQPTSPELAAERASRMSDSVK